MLTCIILSFSKSYSEIEGTWSTEKCRQRCHTVICATFCVWFSSRSKATRVFPKYILKLKARDQSKQAYKLHCHVILKNICAAFCLSFWSNSKPRGGAKSESRNPCWLYCAVAWKSTLMSEIYIDESNFFNACYYKTFVFVFWLFLLFYFFKSAYLILNWVLIYVKRPAKNTLDKSIKFSHLLFLVVLGGCRLFSNAGFRSF